jgi:hypothetical protein
MNEPIDVPMPAKYEGRCEPIEAWIDAARPFELMRKPGPMLLDLTYAAMPTKPDGSPAFERDKTAQYRFIEGSLDSSGCLLVVVKCELAEERVA